MADIFTIILFIFLLILLVFVVYYFFKTVKKECAINKMRYLILVDECHKRGLSNLLKKM